ncbi:MaoC/PaaZ C-terminal domain-containing protein [Telluria mixta]|uniref:MaoC/PaaZ C-terminal domain-containing protein n=1 Tax=Telluria mixta TaxID=34071 RepID=A0ABT2C894_9BURK|nr:MaoC/PaaZ C-terminal domain-containing protein [Telluria mixta]MCS0633582.1 MaoC/PaaZ C-terminal domain-containing protein [Telluria mixta]WEM95952.1 MaoC/PaaZ C-terminal domain-containing protein [Telluria mixta]
MQTAKHLAAAPMPLTLSFDMPAVEQWAQFSSDRNPIHFDLAHARAAGLDALIVHGMLAMMPMKEAASQAVAPDGWMKFRTLLRNPIAHDRDVVFTTKPAADGIAFRLHDTTGKTEHFRGTYGRVGDPSAQLQGDTPRGKPLERAHLDRFFATYPHVRERWIALDAVVFSQFMRSRLHVLERLAHAHMMRLSGGAPASRVVVQSSHTVTFDAAFFDASADADQWNRLHHALLTPELLASGNQIGGVVALPVLCAGRLVMLVEVGLVARFDTDIPN